ncbi:TlpA disulfide reductase family protein, partial [Bacteroides xylanisolvens]
FCAIAIFSSAQEKFSIQGIANEELNNQLLYLCLMDDGEKAKEVVLDSAKVKKGKFSFSGVRQTPNIALIKDRDGETYPLILEKGKIVINLTTRTVGGTPLNDTLDVAWKGMQSVINNNKQIVKSNISLVMSQKSGESFREALKRDTAFAAIWRRNVEIDLAQRDSIRAFVEEHQNSLVGVFLLSLKEVSIYHSLLEDMMSEASSVFAQHVLVKDKLEKMRQMARRFEAEREKKMTPEEREEQKKRQAMDAKIKIGERFPNAKVKDNAGEIKQLSDYVGKGKYVLIDFWASWCGPCRNEMPNVKAAYEKYASKGFEVISISIDKKQKAWRTAIEELGMNWTQVLNVDAADVYGIYAIPKTFLVDPEGIVVAKDLRSKKLEKTLFNLLE